MSMVAGVPDVSIGVGLTFSYFQGELGSKIVTVCSPHIDTSKLAKTFFAKFLTIVRNFCFRHCTMPMLIACI